MWGCFSFSLSLSLSVCVFCVCYFTSTLSVFPYVPSLGKLNKPTEINLNMYGYNQWFLSLLSGENSSIICFACLDSLSLYRNMS